jgi:uncharacterized membrane protein
MQGKATIAGHPIHPILIAFPIAFFPGAVLCDIVSAFNADPIWPSMSVILIGAGILTAFGAAIFGFLDYFTAPMPAQAKNTATVDMVLALISVVIFVSAFFVRYDRPPSVAGYVLTALGALIVLASGSLGGHVAFHFGVGVDDATVPPAGR